jgi:hypothetical protein
MTQKTATTVINPKELVDPDDVLTRAKGKLLKKAERATKERKFVTLAELHHDLSRRRQGYLW